MELLIIGLAEKYPIILTIASIIGMARLILKPLMTFAHSLVAVTPTERDNELLKRAEESAIYKGLVWVLDFVFSLKLKKPLDKVK
jgi:hypothetical protein